MTGHLDEPAEASTVRLPAGGFRILTWPGGTDGTTVFLHGLSGAADVWRPTIAAFGSDRPRCIAIDQRGHGRSPHTPGAYAASDYLGDLLALSDRIGDRVHLVGHSMGARVAILAGARHADRFRSVTIVDIGPEAWKANIETTTAMLTARPERFADRAEALAVAQLIVDRVGIGDADGYVRDRMTEQPDGRLRWRSPTEALVESVTVQRSRNHWRDWDRLALPAMFVRGGATNEVRPAIASAMRRRNPSVRYEELAGIGHNIPLLAPAELADLIRSFWAELP